MCMLCFFAFSLYYFSQISFYCRLFFAFQWVVELNIFRCVFGCICHHAIFICSVCHGLLSVGVPVNSLQLKKPSKFKKRSSFGVVHTNTYTKPSCISVYALRYLLFLPEVCKSQCEQETRMARKSGNSFLCAHMYPLTPSSIACVMCIVYLLQIFFPSSLLTGRSVVFSLGLCLCLCIALCVFFQRFCAAPSIN